LFGLKGFMPMWTADDVGQAFVLLALVFLAAALIRKRSRHLRALFLPTAVIGGFLTPALGPEGVGRLTAPNGIFPNQSFAVWSALPGLLINVMCAQCVHVVEPMRGRRLRCCCRRDGCYIKPAPVHPGKWQTASTLLESGSSTKAP
jgi:hypothetical protein